MAPTGSKCEARTPAAKVSPVSATETVAVCRVASVSDAGLVAEMDADRLLWTLCAAWFARAAWLRLVAVRPTPAWETRNPGPPDDGVGRNGDAVGVEVGGGDGVGEVHLRHPEHVGGCAAGPALGAADGDPHLRRGDRAARDLLEAAYARGDDVAGDVVGAVGRGRSDGDALRERRGRGEEERRGGQQQGREPAECAPERVGQKPVQRRWPERGAGPAWIPAFAGMTGGGAGMTVGGGWPEWCGSASAEPVLPAKAGIHIAPPGAVIPPPEPAARPPAEVPAVATRAGARAERPAAIAPTPGLARRRPVAVASIASTLRGGGGGSRMRAAGRARRRRRRRSRRRRSRGWSG